MKVLVCGSEGRIMSYVIPRLLSAGHSVIGVDNGQKWGTVKKYRGYELVNGDCRSAELLQPLMYRVDGVIQAAATLYGVIGFHKYPADILGSDLEVQKNVLDCALKANVKRFVYISSSMVYDKSNHCSDLDNELGLPVTDYGLSKLVCERLLAAYSRQHGLDYTVWRPFNALDPDEQTEGEQGISHVIPDMLHRLIIEQQNPLEILGDGNQVRCFCHIREIGEALADYSFDSRTKNGTFNLGRKEALTMKDLALRLYDKACYYGLIETPSKLQFKSLPVPSTDVRERIGNFDKIKTHLGWESNVCLDVMLDECVKTYVSIKRPAFRTSSLSTANQIASFMIPQG